MFGNSGRNSGIHKLHDYKAALEWFERVKPIRGSGANAGVKPLGHRDRPHFQILKGEAGEIKCRCYNTDVVTFHPDGIVHINNAGWNTMTTANFIYDVVRIGSVISDNDLQVSIGGGWYRVKSGIKIKRNESGVYEVIEFAPHAIYNIDRKKMNALRKQVKPYRDFVAGMLKVREPVFERGELEAALHETGVTLGSNWSLEVRHWREDAAQIKPRLYKFFETITQEDKEGNWYRAFLQLVWSGVAYHHRVIAAPALVNKMLDELLIATHPEVLIVNYCAAGEFKKNAYEKFVPYKEMTN